MVVPSRSSVRLGFFVCRCVEALAVRKEPRLLVLVAEMCVGVELRNGTATTLVARSKMTHRHA